MMSWRKPRHRIDETDFRERLLDGVFGYPQRVGDGQSAHVVLQEGIQQLRDLAAQTFTVAGGGGLRCVRGDIPHPNRQQQSKDRLVLHRHPLN